MPFSGSEPQYPTAARAVGRHRGAEAAQSDPGAGQEPCAMGPAACLQTPTTGGLDGEPQTGATDLAGGGATEAPAVQAEARTALRRLPNVAEGRVPAPCMGD
jgi:hypothetical protein